MAIDLELGISSYHRDDEQQWILLAHEITAQKRLENELKTKARQLETLNASLARVTQEAEAANRAKSEFLADISHEIRTPMTAILGFVDLLQIDLREPRHLQAVQTIKRNANFLVELINDILDLSKIEAHKFEIEHVAVAPAEVVAEVGNLMTVPAAAKGVALVIEYLGPIPETIQTDPMRLRQILINLVGNAVKFTDQGEVRVSVSLVGNDPHAMVEFAVSDTGIGIPPEEQARVFEPFLQADTAAERRVGGTGLGLTISRRLAVVLGGAIELESRSGVGSTFRLRIPAGLIDEAALATPVTHEPVRAGEPSADVAQRRLNCRVLAADDRRDNRILIAEFLRKAGASVTLADSGRLAVDLAAQAAEDDAPFDIVLMDMQMPDIDGYKATEQLRAAGHRMPIIALTASAMKGDRQKCLDVGCDVYLPKPIDFKLLIETVSRQLARSGS